MRSRSPFSALRLISIFLILGSLILFALQLVRFSRLWANFPPGLSIGGIPIGQLNRQQAAQRLLEAFSRPVELHYNTGNGSSVIQLNPAVVGYELDLESMLAVADLERTRQPFWLAYWDFLWGRSGAKADIPLRVTYSEVRLRNFLEQEVAARYDRPPVSAMPVVGTVNFQPGSPGSSLNIDQALILIDNALRSIDRRVVELPLEETRPTRPSFQNLGVLLRQTVSISGFDGVIGVGAIDLQTGQEIDFAYNQGQPVTMPPEVAFSASSTIKIPIMISVYRHLDGSFDTKISEQLLNMIAKSVNPAADWLMENVIDPFQGPLFVTEDIVTLGLKNTFLAGYFYSGAPLLKIYQTSANQRTDLSTDPDPYSQSTPMEIAMLLEDIYQCSQNNGGTLIAAFPGEISQAECKAMVDWLVEDHIALLIQAGVPDGTRVAHKHGWVADSFFVIHDMSDAAIVFTPGGNYVLVVYLYHPVQLVFDPANELVKNLSRAVYNFYNLPTP